MFDFKIDYERLGEAFHHQQRIGGGVVKICFGIAWIAAPILGGIYLIINGYNNFSKSAVEIYKKSAEFYEKYCDEHHDSIFCLGESQNEGQEFNAEF